MDWSWILILVIGSTLALIALGVPVVISFFAVNLVSAWFIMGGIDGVSQVVSNATVSVTTFALVPVPMFVLMGELFFRTGLAPRVFDALDRFLGAIPGRLCFLTVGGGTVFSALTGSSMANTAMMGSLMIPDMTRRGYKPHMIMGPIMGTGGLAMIIPPSGLAVLLGSLARIDIGALLIAGIVPGLLLAIFYCATIYIQLRIDPEAAPSYKVDPAPMSARLINLAVNVLPMGLVIFAVVGMIILGWATPSESSAFGVLAVLTLAVAFRKLTLTAIIESVAGTLRVTVMLLIIIVGSSTFSQLLGFSGATTGLITWATGIDASWLVLLLVMFGVMLLLGMFMDQLSMLMLTLPIFMPLAEALHFDPVWFGIILLLALEISLTTPPFGLLLFVMLGVAPEGTTLGQVARAAMPFILCDLIVVALLIAFPAIVLFLPNAL